MADSKSVILITTGLTGGHFFPAVCFAEAYRKEFPSAEIWFLLCKESTPFDLKRHLRNFHIKIISVEPFPKALSFKLASFLIHYVQRCAETTDFFRVLKPSALVSFGSYGAFPAVLAAWFRKIPVVVHEQNRISGWANRLSAFFAKRVATSFKETLGNLPEKKVCYIGYPIRSEFRKAVQPEEQDSKPPRARVILVIGGSQGSRVLNKIMLDFFSALTSEEKEKFAVIHIAGETEFPKVEKQYQALGVRHRVCAFSDEMAGLYRQADIVIARAGAGTIFELAVLGRPALLIPYPFAYAHQSKNANYLAERGAAAVMEEKDLSPRSFKRAVMDLLESESGRREMSRALRRLDVEDADRRLVQLVREVIEHPHGYAVERRNTENGMGDVS